MSGDGGLLVISPHLDDAVLGCGCLIAARPGAVVATVFAGRPASPLPVRPWDRDCGFGDADDVIGARRDEDRRALHVLQATPVWLEFRDSQYAPAPPPEAVTHALATLVEREAPATIAFPLGLFHSDHLLAADATLALVDAHAGRTWLAYEDALYRTLTGAVDGRRSELARAGWTFTAIAPTAPASTQRLKREAAKCYRSQIRGLATPGRLAHERAFERERLWRVGRSTHCA